MGKVIHFNKHERVEAEFAKALEEHKRGEITDLFLCYKLKPGENGEERHARYWFGDSCLTILGLLQRMIFIV